MNKITMILLEKNRKKDAQANWTAKIGWHFYKSCFEGKFLETEVKWFEIESAFNDLSFWSSLVDETQNETITLSILLVTSWARQSTITLMRKKSVVETIVTDGPFV